MTAQDIMCELHLTEKHVVVHKFLRIKCFPPK